MAKHTIKIKKYLDVVEEYEAAAAITPGHLVEFTSAGKVQKHSTANGDALPMFALEDEMQGNSISDDYSSGDQVQVWIPQRGAQVYAILANGENASVGSWLSSNGDGTLKVHTATSVDSDDAYTAYTNQIVAQALEAVDMSGSSGVDPSGRIIVRIV